jgi:hypothetical protein
MGTNAGVIRTRIKHRANGIPLSAMWYHDERQGGVSINGLFVRVHDVEHIANIPRQ